MKKLLKFPGKPFRWYSDTTIYISIPFTWNLPKIKWELNQMDFTIEKAIVGGPAVKLIPGYFKELGYVEEQSDYIGILQKINPMATKTTLGCPSKCEYCAVGKGLIEGKFKELADWPDRPIICDNNLLAASQNHFDKVIDRLIKYPTCDFNQGLDISFFTEYHAKRLAELKKPIIRLSLDSIYLEDRWQNVYELLRSSGIRKSNIRSYVLIGYEGDWLTDWEKCEFIEAFNVDPSPMWFHTLDCMDHNTVTDIQKAMGWTNKRRVGIMGYYYRKRIQGDVPEYIKTKKRIKK